MPLKLPIKDNKIPRTKLNTIRSNGLIKGNGMNNSNKYSWKELSIYKNKRENYKHTKPWAYRPIG